MKRLLTLAAVAEATTGLALLVVPALVGRLLLGAELTGVSIPVARVAGIALIALGVACLPGIGIARHVDLQRPGDGLSRLRRHRWRMGRAAVVAGGRGARCLDGSCSPVRGSPRRRRCDAPGSLASIGMPREEVQELPTKCR